MMRYFSLAIALVASNVWGDLVTISQFGIDSKITGLDGTGIQIGTAEGARSGKAGYDDADQSAPNTIPIGVYHQNSGGMDLPNFNIDSHATKVAGVMIGKPNVGEEDYTNWEGVAPNAELHSLAIDDNTQNDVLSALGLNRLALLNGGAIRAINFSAGRSLQGLEVPDGNSHIAQFIDWSARRHDVLYVVAWGNDTNPPFRTPADEYNSIVVGASTFFPNGRYGKFWPQNQMSGHPVDRTGIDILAPGASISVLDLNGVPDEVVGTSYSAPHVTGATALLQQYSLQQIDAMNPRFNSRSQRHEVMKAVMMNSADKLEGVHGSNRTILDLMDNDWTDSDAFESEYVPLDDQLGAGHLNVRRAVQQLAPGEYSPAEEIPFIGWDLGSIDTGTIGASFEYVFDAPFEAGQYIAITLVWDRRIESTGGNTYNEGDQFTSHGVANLDLWLSPADGEEFGDAVNTSIATESNVEHIFFEIEEAGEYKIAVSHQCCGPGTPLEQTDYALAWWYGNPTTPVTGDYDGNGSVGPEDYAVWQSTFGSTTDLDADGNGDNIINAADYVIWRDNLGAGSGSGTVANVPEPSSLMLFVAAGTIFVWRRAARQKP